MYLHTLLRLVSPAYGLLDAISIYIQLCSLLHVFIYVCVYIYVCAHMFGYVNRQLNAFNRSFNVYSQVLKVDKKCKQAFRRNFYHKLQVQDQCLWRYRRSHTHTHYSILLAQFLAKSVIRRKNSLKFIYCKKREVLKPSMLWNFL